jgi:hypothetical protein
MAGAARERRSGGSARAAVAPARGGSGDRAA